MVEMTTNYTLEHMPPYFRLGYLEAKSEAATEIAALKARVAELEGLINSPEIEDWLAGVPLEAAHQVSRWGAAHDQGKTTWDWIWLVGYLAQKAAASHTAGDIEKAKHHTVSTAAALLNWHRALTGSDNRMRPGIADPEQAALAQREG